MSELVRIRPDLVEEGLGMPLKSSDGTIHYHFNGDAWYHAIQPDELDDESWNTIIFINDELYQAVGIDWEWKEKA